MNRLRSVAIAASLALAATAAADAQNRQTADDQLLRLFARSEARHRSSRRNLAEILLSQPNFRIELQAVAGRLGTDPAWLLDVIATESLFDPGARNPLPGQTASGLLQIIKRTARRLGTTAEAIRRMSPVDQLRLVEKYLDPFKGRLNTLPNVYMAVFRGSIIEGGDEVIVVDSSKEPRVYALNRSLDLDNDGRITKGELGLAALSVGRFLPAPPARSGDESANNPSRRTAFVRGKGQTPQRHVDSLDSASPATTSAQSSRPTRSIYIRRGGDLERP
jgi:hypothetical protein